MNNAHCRRLAGREIATNLLLGAVRKPIFSVLVSAYRVVESTQSWTMLIPTVGSRLIDRQPRRLIYLKDGGRFDAPKIHDVFTQLLRKCFTGEPKVRLRPPKSRTYGASKRTLLTSKTAWIKIAYKCPLESTEHRSGKDSNFRFG